jgi:3-oxoacyl-[acyl-carrier protein] reductase
MTDGARKTFDFSGKVAIVTGGASGIGKATIESFAACGARAALFDMQDEAAESVCASVRGAGGEALYFKTDVSSIARVKTNVSMVKEQWGRVDIIVCSAGVVHAKPILESTEEEFDRLYAINVKGIFACCIAVLPIMMEQRYGKIINIGSVAGKTGGGFHGSTLYGSTKGAVIAMTKGIAREAAPYDINVNCICPGAVDTPMLKEVTPEKRARLIGMSMLPRFAEAQDIADTALFLASDYSKHITSGVINVDGGINKGN